MAVCFNPRWASQSFYLEKILEGLLVIVLFQSPMGFPGHLAANAFSTPDNNSAVSIPDGLPRPFSQILEELFWQFFVVSIPDGLPRPISRMNFLQYVLPLTWFQSP